MTLSEFVVIVPNFSRLSIPDKIQHFGWFLHVHQKQARFNQGAIRACFIDQHLEPPNLSKEFGRLQDRNPPVLLRDPDGYRLEHRARAALDQKYGEHPGAVAVSQLLKDLPGKISDQAERLFLSEALKCYRATAYRAAVVMTWNLAYDHLLNWVINDAARVVAFNSKIVARVGAKRGTGLTVNSREEFELLTEREVLDICGNAGIFPSDNIKKILEIQLTKRNIAAHPSLIEIEQPTADETIHTLVTNVVLKLV